MKKTFILLAVFAMTYVLTACAGVSHCKECDDEVYQDGYCEYHYAVQAAKEAVDDTAKELFDRVLEN